MREAYTPIVLNQCSRPKGPNTDPNPNPLDGFRALYTMIKGCRLQGKTAPP